MSGLPVPRGFGRIAALMVGVNIVIFIGAVASISAAIKWVIS